MQGSIWKSIALVGVICIGGLATREVHQRLQARNATIPPEDADQLAAEILAAGEQTVDASLSDSQFDAMFADTSQTETEGRPQLDPAAAIERALQTTDANPHRSVDTSVRVEEIAQGGNPFAEEPTAFAAATTPDATAAEPSTVQPAAFEPAGFEPAGFEPAGFEPAGFEPAAFETAASDSGVVDPEAFEPAAVEPAAFQPEPASAARTFAGNETQTVAVSEQPAAEAEPFLAFNPDNTTSVPVRPQDSAATLKSPPDDTEATPLFSDLPETAAQPDTTGFAATDDKVQPVGFADETAPFRHELAPAAPVENDFTPFRDEQPLPDRQPVQPTPGQPLPIQPPGTALQPAPLPPGQPQAGDEQPGFEPFLNPAAPETATDPRSLPAAPVDTQPFAEDISPANRPLQPEPAFDGLPIVEETPGGNVPMLDFGDRMPDFQNNTQIPRPVPDNSFESPAHPLAGSAPNQFEPFPQLPNSIADDSGSSLGSHLSDRRSPPPSFDQPRPLRPTPNERDRLPSGDFADERGPSREPRTFNGGPVIEPRRLAPEDGRSRRSNGFSNNLTAPPRRERDRGVRQVSSVMRPNVVLRKDAPENATVDTPLDYRIFVRNDGDAPAYDVVVEDEITAGARVEGASPAAQRDRQTNRLIWKFDEVQPGETKEIVVRVTPTGEGTMDGVATVNFKSRVKATTVITAPKLELQMVGPDEVRLGEEVAYRYVVTNTGTGEARNVYVRTVLPAEGGLKHPAGRDLEYEIASLKPAEQREIVLSVVAAEPGEYRAQAEVTSAGNVADQASWRTNIVGAQLKIDRRGPKRRFVGRSAVYENVISNETNFDAIDARVAEQVPEGMRFVTAGKGGRYDPQTRTVTWQINRLGAGKVETLQIELIPTAAGARESIVTVFENAGIRSEDYVSTTQVEDLHNISADISQLDGPVAIGETFGFTISIDNRGTADATDVELYVDVPTEIQVVGAGSREIPAKLRPGNKVQYHGVVRIGPGEKKDFEIKLRGNQPIRNGLVKANVRYKQMSEPLVIAESVTVYRDDL